MSEVKDILVERGSRYGKFSSHAALTQALKSTFSDFVIDKYDFGSAAEFDAHFPPYMTEALDMIFHKIGRIGNGDPFYDDSWIDIAGYAQLVVDELHEVG